MDVSFAAILLTGGNILNKKQISCASWLKIQGEPRGR